MAAEMAALNRIKYEWTPVLQAVCDQFDDSMRAPCEAITQQLVRFYDERTAVFATLSKVEGEARASQAFGGSALDGILPASLRRLLALASIGSPAEAEAEAEAEAVVTELPTPQPTPSPSVSLPTLHAKQHRHKACKTQVGIRTPRVSFISPAPSTAAGGAGSDGSAATTRTSSPMVSATCQAIDPSQSSAGRLMVRFRVPSSSSIYKSLQGETGRQDFMAKLPEQTPLRDARPFEQLLHNPANIKQTRNPVVVFKRKRPLLEPILPPIKACKVDAAEFVFQYLPFGAGWFVLRCVRCIAFKAHPLKEEDGRPSPGLWHFNEAVCKHHKRKRNYTEETMMVSFARRVVDKKGEDVTSEWVQRSNDHLAVRLLRERQKWDMSGGAGELRPQTINDDGAKLLDTESIMQQ